MPPPAAFGDADEPVGRIPAVGRLAATWTCRRLVAVGIVAEALCRHGVAGGHIRVPGAHLAVAVGGDDGHARGARGCHRRPALEAAVGPHARRVAAHRHAGRLVDGAGKAHRSTRGTAGELVEGVDALAGHTVSLLHAGAVHGGIVGEALRAGARAAHLLHGRTGEFINSIVEIGVEVEWH